MRTRHWGMGFGALVVGLLVISGGVRAADDLPGPIDSLADLQDTGKMVFKMADINNDGQISQKEAIDAGNLLVGGFFFRADANGDGAVSKEEAQQARESFLQQKPLLRLVLQRAGQRGAAQPGQPAEPGQPAQPGQRGSRGQNPAQGFMSFADSNNDGQLQAAELRQAVQTGVQSLYAAADTNRDGQMSPEEVNAAVAGMARAAAQASFQAADKDGNGSLSQEEFNQAIVEPANAVFRVVDANGDGQISQQEAQSAQRVVINQIRILNVPARQRARAGQNVGQPGTAPALGSPTAPGTTTPRRPRLAVPAGEEAREPATPSIPTPRRSQQPAQPRRPAPPASPAPETQPPQ